jgi:hypothetical protein
MHTRRERGGNIEPIFYEDSLMLAQAGDIFMLQSNVWHGSSHLRCGLV